MPSRIAESVLIIAVVCVSTGCVTNAPTLVESSSNVDYPPLEWRLGATPGRVLLEFVITKSGETGDVSVIKAESADAARTELFERDALRSAREWRFVPSNGSTRYNEPARYRASFVFELEPCGRAKQYAQVAYSIAKCETRAVRLPPPSIQLIKSEDGSGSDK